MSDRYVCASFTARQTVEMSNCNEAARSGSGSIPSASTRRDAASYRLSAFRNFGGRQRSPGD